MTLVPVVDTTAPSRHQPCHHQIYKLTCSEFDQLIDRAGGQCERCGIPEDQATSGRLVIDHDHGVASDAVRGLLCARCNGILGRVDAGAYPVDSETAAYLALSSAGVSKQLLPIRTDVWNQFGQVVGDANRFDEVQQFVAWRLRNPTAQAEWQRADGTHLFLVSVEAGPDGMTVGAKRVFGARGRPGREIERRVIDAVRSAFEPDPVPLDENADAVGVQEIAGLLGVTKQRAGQLAQYPDFPKAVSVLASGPVYLRAAVIKFKDERWNRRKGRPPKERSET